jgi:hypothetical protein
LAPHAACACCVLGQRRCCCCWALLQERAQQGHCGGCLRCHPGKRDAQLHRSGRQQGAFPTLLLFDRYFRLCSVTASRVRSRPDNEAAGNADRHAALRAAGRGPGLSPCRTCTVPHLYRRSWWSRSACPPAGSSRASCWRRWQRRSGGCPGSGAPWRLEQTLLPVLRRGRAAGGAVSSPTRAPVHCCPAHPPGTRSLAAFDGRRRCLPFPESRVATGETIPVASILAQHIENQVKVSSRGCLGGGSQMKPPCRRGDGR